MPFINADRIKETTITTGTGNIALLGAVSGFRAFYPTLSVGDTFKYFIVSTSGTEWESGLGTLTASSTLARTTVQSSSNVNPLTAVNFSAGLKEVGIGPTAGGETPWNPVTNTLNISVNALNDVAITSPTANQVLKYSGTEWTNQADAVNVGTVTTVSVVAANGFGGTVATDTTTPAITLTTSITGLLKGNASALLAAVAGTDYVTPTGSAAGLTSFPTLNQNTTGTAATVTTNANLMGHITSVGNTAALGSFTSAQLYTAVTDRTGTGGAAVFATSPTLVTPFSNTLSAVPVTVNGPGNSVTIAAGSGVAGATSNPGGSLILQAGIQATSGGDGKVIVRQVSGQTSNLQEWQNSGGAAKLLVTNTGSLYPATSGGADLGTYTQGFNVLRIRTIYIESGSGNSGFACDQNTGVWAAINGLLGFSSGPAGSSTIDTTMYRDAADTLALRRSTNAQAFRVYNTFTDASNYERLSATWASNICTIGLENAGTGVARVLNINATTIKTTVYTVGTLPGAATAGAGARAFVSDANATTFATFPIGGGGNGVPVYSNGANWFIG